MTVSTVISQRLDVPRWLGWPICVAGGLGIFATYWDEAWHTDIGRDSLWTAPHVLLYGAMAVVGLSIAEWGIRVLRTLRSVRRTAARLPLLAASLGGLAALAAAPIDAAWHTSFGRDAVEWSPPHMLVVFAATGIALGVLAGIAPDARALRAGAGALLLANAAATVFEYEADVPQFTEILYLPILLAAGLLVANVVRRTVPVPAPVVTVVLIYVAVRLLIAGALAGLGRSTPDLPIAVLGLMAYDLPLSGWLRRTAAAAVATAAAALGASALHLASEPPTAVALTAAPVVVIGALVLFGARRWSRVALSAALIAIAYGVGLTATAGRAEAHDPGQGVQVAPIRLTALTDGTGRIRMRAELESGCSAASPVRLFARRAGRTVTADLVREGACRYVGTVTVGAPGRWFTYVELEYRDRSTQAWLPVDSAAAAEVSRRRTLYRPAGTEPGRRRVEVVAGVPIYAAGLALLGLGVAAIRRPTADEVRVGDGVSPAQERPLDGGP